MKKTLKNVCKSSFLGLLIVSGLYFFSEYNAYHPKPPAFVGSVAEPFHGQGLDIQAKAYDEHESQAYLSKNLQDMGFQPVQVTIQNNTAHTFLLSSQGVDLPNATTNKVSACVTARAIPRSIAFKVAGLLFWPFLIPATVDSMLTIKSHIKMKKDYHAKSIKEEGESIIPYSTVHRILFVPSDQYSDTFTLHLKDQKTGYFHPFTVKINS